MVAIAVPAKSGEIPALSRNGCATPEWPSPVAWPASETQTLEARAVRVARHWSHADFVLLIQEDSMSRTRRRSAIAALAVLSVALAACGGDDAFDSGTDASQQAGDTTPGDTTPGDTAPGDTTPAAAQFPVTVAGGAGDVTLDAPATAIVSLSPTHTEMLFAIGAGDQVAAVDSYSNHPPEAAEVLTDLSAYEPSAEAIAGYEPDLVVIGDNTSGIAEQLGAIGIPVWFGPAAVTFDDVYEQIEALGALTGEDDGADALVQGMRSDLEAIVADIDMPDEPLTYYHELDNTYYSVTSNTLIGQVYGLFGLRNIADTAEGTTDYPQLSAEFIVSQDPDLVFLADTVCCGESAETVAARPGWQSLTAVVDGHVIETNDDLSSRWGPRIVEYARLVADAIAEIIGG